MGKYVKVNSKGKVISSDFEEKIEDLIKDGAIKINPPINFIENLVCVVDNGFFAAAGYAYSEREMNFFINGMANRPFQWLIYNHAKDLAQ